MHFLLFSLLLSLLPLVYAQDKTTEQLISEAKDWMKKGEPQQAIDLLSIAISKDPSDYLTLYKRAAMYLSLGKYEDALSDFNSILEIQPDFDQALLQRSKIYLKQCELEKAQKDLKKIHQSKEAQEISSEIEVASKARDLLKSIQSSDKTGQKSLELLQKLIQTCSLEPQFRKQRAELYESLSDYHQAINEYQKWMQLTRVDLKKMYELAQLQVEKLGEVEPAIQTLKKCLHSDPENPKCAKYFKKLKKIQKHFDKIEEMKQKGQLRKSLEFLQSDLEVLIKDLNLAHQGDVYLQLKQKACDLSSLLKKTQIALDYCNEALSLDQNHVDSLINRAQVHLQLEQYDQAIQDLQKAKETQPQNRQILELLQKAQKLLKQSKQRDYYKVLGVSRDASDKEIKKAFRKKAIEFHPDKYDGDKTVAEKKMAEVNQAYEVLSDPELKQRYDNGDDPNDPTGGAQQGHPFFHQGGGGMPIFFQGGGFPFGGGGGGGQNFHYEFRYG